MPSSSSTMDFEKENINNSTTLSSSSSSSSENENKNDLAVVFSVTLHLDTISMPKLFETHVESRSVGIPHRVMVWNAAHGVISRVAQRRSANEEDMEILRCIIHISRAYVVIILSCHSSYTRKYDTQNTDTATYTRVTRPFGIGNP